jgi:hypothetical protein
MRPRSESRPRESARSERTTWISYDYLDLVLFIASRAGNRGRISAAILYIWRRHPMPGVVGKGLVEIVHAAEGPLPLRRTLHPWLEVPRTNDPGPMFVRSSFRGNAVAAKSRRRSHAKKRYVRNLPSYEDPSLLLQRLGKDYCRAGARGSRARALLRRARQPAMRCAVSLLRMSRSRCNTFDAAFRQACTRHGQ